MDFSSLFCRSASPLRLSQRGAMFAACESVICFTICAILSSITAWICAGSSVLVGGHGRGDVTIALIFVVISVSWR